MPIEIIVPSQTSAVNKLNESIKVENTFQSLDRKRINNTDDNKSITNKIASSADSAITKEINLLQCEENLYTSNDNKKKLKVHDTRSECPATICIAGTIDAIKSKRLFRVLLDSGSSACLIKKSALPKYCKPKELSVGKSFKTLAGKISSTQVVTLKEIRLPEFDKNRRITEQRALVFDNPSITYDIILGTDFLAKVGMKLDYQKNRMEWLDCILPMRPPRGLNSDDFNTMVDQWYVQVEDDILGEDWLQCFATKILDAKYEWTDITKLVNDMTHLHQTKREDLLSLLQQHAKMFD